MGFNSGLKGLNCTHQLSIFAADDNIMGVAYRLQRKTQKLY
jgi:hypothetical protein